jgi:hypothetical protein
MAAFDHPPGCRLPFDRIRHIEDEQIVLRRRRTGRMPAGARELQMIGCAVVTDHHAVEAVMILEVAEKLEAQPIGIEADDRFQLVGRAGDPELRYGVHAGPTSIIAGHHQHQCVMDGSSDSGRSAPKATRIGRGTADWACAAPALRTPKSPTDHKIS